MTLDIDLKIRKGRDFSATYHLTTPVINGDPLDRDLTGATFIMQFRATRGGAVVDLAPTYAAVNLALGQFSFSSTAAQTAAMATASGYYEVQMTLAGAISTEIEGAYSVILPVVQP